MKRNFYIAIVLLSVLAWPSCKKSSRFSEVPERKDSLKIEIRRFDRDLIQLDTRHADQSVRNLYRKYPDFLPFFLSEALGIDPADTTKVSQLLCKFVTDKTFSTVNADVLKTFQDTKPYEHSLEAAFSLLRYYFPELKVPEVYFFVSGFNQPVLFTNDFVAVGADLYLGSNYPKYADFTYNYLTYNMRPQSIVPDVVSVYLFKSFPVDFKENRLLDNMLYRGKIMYLLSVVLPDEQLNDLMGYSDLQWEWCRKYEKEIWQTVVDQKDLFSTDKMLIGKYMNDAPFTTPVSQESPGRLGTWVGWQIIKKYVDKSPGLTLPELLKENDYQKILQKSEYNP